MPDIAREGGSGSYLLFEQEPAQTQGRTLRWRVEARRNGAPLGVVKWFGRWRCYSFFPEAYTTFNAACLANLADFCAHRTDEHREKLRTEREARLTQA